MHGEESERGNNNVRGGRHARDDQARHPMYP